MKKLFRRFVAPKDRPFFDNFCKSVFEHRGHSGRGRLAAR
jgi:inhibitor of KinA sporulation pathway (predicted exonuclease)